LNRKRPTEARHKWGKIPSGLNVHCGFILATALHTEQHNNPGERDARRPDENLASETSYHVRVPQIRVLSDEIVNRIAAGEVVERPASVVKELVENSLDAGSERIEIELEQGGRSLVRVTDDGCGMDPDDALLALERHATSKIISAADLDRIATLGFRGEALPSMAAVARLVLTTCADPAEGGARVTVEGGRILGVDGVARARGTTVEVRDLFFNTPARRKFLRAPATELRHAQEMVVGAALARPDVACVLRHGGRTLLDVPRSNDPSQRLRDLWRRVEGPVRRFEASGGQISVWGLLAPGSGSGPPSLTLIVNGRPVRDRLLVGAVRRVLREVGSGFGGVRVAMFVDLPPDAVDVNVHPAKAEVRFARGGAVFALVDRAVRTGITESHGTVAVDRIDSPEAVAELAPSGYGEPPGGSARSGGLFPHPVYGRGPDVEDGRYRATPEVAGGHPRGAAGARAGPADTPFGRLIGQYRQSFLLLEDDWGLVIVDQHVAHERVLYERIRRRLAESQAPSQRLLEPVLVEVGESGAEALPSVQELLARAGIETEVFGHGTLRIAALPPELDPDSARDLVEDLLDRATALDGVPERVEEELADELAAALSCRAAIKVNHQLSVEEQRALLDDLGGAENPYRCPHGRPIVLRLSQDEMERRLGRR
jgi:DNA mismatch repair protein MutL